MHAESHPMAGKTVLLGASARDPQRGIVTGGVEFDVENWYDYAKGRGGGTSWMMDQTFATLWYAERARSLDLPFDDEVVYGHIRGLGHLVHVSELGEFVRVWDLVEIGEEG